MIGSDYKVSTVNGAGGNLARSNCSDFSWWSFFLEIRMLLSSGYRTAPLTEGFYDLFQGGMGGGDHSDLLASAEFKSFHRHYLICQDVIFWGSRC